MKYVSKEIFDFLVYDPKEELKKRGLNICGEPADKVDIHTAFTCGVRFVLDLVDKAKPADVVPVVHAHWIINPKYSIVCNCSNCGVAVRGGLGENYCFNCGAKMDEEVDNGG